MIHHNPYIYSCIDEFDANCTPIPCRLAEQYAQCGEDIIVSKVWAAMVRTNPELSHGNFLYVEIGANHAIAGSNTFLLSRHGLDGVLVEANPKLIPELQRIRSRDVVINAAITTSTDKSVQLYISNQHELSSTDKEFVTDWHEGRIGLADSITVPAMRINELLIRHVGSRPIAYLSIDVEGADFSILTDIDFESWRPIMIQIEPSDHFSPGTSDQIFDYMLNMGYQLLAVTDVNQIFVDNFLFQSEPSSSQHKITSAARQIAIDRQSLIQDLEQRERELASMLSGQEIALNTLREEIKILKSSKSWRITAPLRYLASLLRP